MYRKLPFNEEHLENLFEETALHLGERCTDHLDHCFAVYMTKHEGIDIPCINVLNEKLESCSEKYEKTLEYMAEALNCENFDIMEFLHKSKLITFKKLMDKREIV